MSLFTRRWLKKKTRLAQLVVHTQDRQTIEGLLDVVSDDGLVLRNARYLDAEGKPALHGEVFIPRENVSFVQVKEGGKL